jgi:EpsI family protein
MSIPNVFPGWNPNFATAVRQARRAYGSPAGERVETYQALYLKQSPGSELIHYSNRIDGDRWIVYSESVDVRRLSSGEVLTVRSLQSRAPAAGTWRIEYVYVVDDMVTAKPWAVQLVYAIRSWVTSVPARVFAVATPCTSSCEEATRTLEGYWASLPAVP